MPVIGRPIPPSVACACGDNARPTVVTNAPAESLATRELLANSL
jgi:hypothetical protein